ATTIISSIKVKPFWTFFIRRGLPVRYSLSKHAMFEPLSRRTGPGRRTRPLTGFREEVQRLTRRRRNDGPGASARPPCGEDRAEAASDAIGPSKRKRAASGGPFP